MSDSDLNINLPNWKQGGKKWKKNNKQIKIEQTIINEARKDHKFISSNQYDPTKDPMYDDQHDQYGQNDQDDGDDPYDPYDYDHPVVRSVGNIGNVSKEFKYPKHDTRHYQEDSKKPADPYTRNVHYHNGQTRRMKADAFRIRGPYSSGENRNVMKARDKKNNNSKTVNRTVERNRLHDHKKCILEVF